eukprot:5564617-Prymnesium_polylepis.1
MVKEGVEHIPVPAALAFKVGLTSDVCSVCAETVRVARSPESRPASPFALPLGDGAHIAHVGTTNLATWDLRPRALRPGPRHRQHAC